MVIPLIIRGAGMAAKGAKNFGSSANNVAQQGWQGAQNIGGAVQQGWQKVPGSAKVGAGVGMMTGLAVGGVKKGQRAVFGGVQKTYGGWVLIFPIILAVLDYVLGKNGVPLDFLFNNPNLFVDITTRIVVDSPYWVFLVIFLVLRKPFGREGAKNEILFLAIMMFLVFFTMVVAGPSLWIFYHLGFAFLTFAFLLQGFKSDEPIGQKHWVFLVIFVVDIFGLATFKGMYDSGFFAFTIPELFLNRILFPWWFFYYLALIRDSSFKTGATIFVILFYGGYIGFEYVGTRNIDLQGLTTEKEQAGSAIVKSITNWGDFAKQWFTERISYAITGKVEENQFEPIGVYLENVQSADTKYFEDENVIIWGTVKARTLDDPINIKVGCLAERDKIKTNASKTDPDKKFSVFTLEEQDFACTFNKTLIGDKKPLRTGSNTIKAFADFNFETLAYLKTYFIDRERQRAMTREDQDIFEVFGIQDINPVAVYTNGPAKIEMGTNNPLVGVSDNYIVEPSLDIKISNREGWQGKITRLKEFVLFLPEGAEIEPAISCDKEFERYTASMCKDASCVNFVKNGCLEVCDGYLITPDECDKICKENPSGDRCLKCTESVKKLNACDQIAISDKTKCKDEPFVQKCVDCKKEVGISDYNSCTNTCDDNLNKCQNSCDSFFQEGGQGYNGYALKQASEEREKDFENGILFRCRFRPEPGKILGNAPITTKSFRVKARYDYTVEKSVSVNIEKAPDKLEEGFVGAPLNLMIKGSNGALTAEGSVTLGNNITLVWDKSINDGGNSNDVIKYRVYRKDGDTGEFNKKGEVDAKGTALYEYTDKPIDLSGNFKYSYYVDALNKDNKFEKSAKILVVSKAPKDGAPPLEEGQLYVSSQDQEKTAT